MNAFDYLSAVVYGKGDSVETACQAIEDGIIDTNEAMEALKAIKM